MKIGEEAAQAIALRALAFVAEDEERLVRFLAATGTNQDDIRNQLHDPTFLGGVLDFVVSDDAMTQEFADRAGLDPAMPSVARNSLPGAPDPDG